MLPLLLYYIVVTYCGHFWANGTCFMCLPQHAFHFHCISRWLKTRQVCPLDNREWEFQKWVKRQQNTTVATLVSAYLSETMNCMTFALVWTHMLIVLVVFCSTSADMDTSCAIFHPLRFRTFSAHLLHYGPSQCIIPFLFYICVMNLDCFVLL